MKVAEFISLFDCKGKHLKFTWLLTDLRTWLSIIRLPVDEGYQRKLPIRVAESRPMRISPRSMDAEEVVQKTPAAVAVAIGGFSFLFGASTCAPGGAVHEGVETFGIVSIAVRADRGAWAGRGAWMRFRPKG